MKIALIGYGRMGKTIEEVALRRGHSIALRITSANKHDITGEHFKGVDVAIEFTRPEAAKDNVIACLTTGVPVVCGTTGWNEGLPLAEAIANANHTAFLHASNFSVGVNIFFEINKLLASLMNNYPEYKVAIEETHHTQKKDAPSGTAITIAEQVLGRVERLSNWTLADSSAPGSLPITALRVEHVPGTHEVRYSSAIDDIQIIHTAHSREGFALGAVLAAEYIAGRQGTYTISDVLLHKK